MRAAFAASFAQETSLDGLRVDEWPNPEPPSGWTRVAVKAASLNHHDLWTLRGIGIKSDQLPMILGCDAAGVDERTGNDVIVHAVVNSEAWRGDDTLDPRRTLLSEKHQGTLADYVVVPAHNVVPKPAGLSWDEAACLPTAWLTAYRMLFIRGRARPGETVLVQGASGGVGSAAIVMARAAGLRVVATARTEGKRERARRIGAHEVLASGESLRERVDLVVETVGKATWAHSVRSLRPGGRIVISGATSGADPSAELTRVFFLQLEVIGSTMGTRAELAELVRFMEATGVRPLIDRKIGLEDIACGLRAMADGEVFGKVVVA